MSAPAVDPTVDPSSLLTRGLSAGLHLGFRPHLSQERGPALVTCLCPGGILPLDTHGEQEAGPVTPKEPYLGGSYFNYGLRCHVCKRLAQCLGPVPPPRSWGAGTAGWQAGGSLLQSRRRGPACPSSACGPKPSQLRVIQQTWDFFKPQRGHGLHSPKLRKGSHQQLTPLFTSSANGLGFHRCRMEGPQRPLGSQPGAET